MEPNLIAIGQLLSDVSVLTKANEARRKASGEDFNVFQVLGIHTDEVRTHSRLLTELLNPQGSHGQGDAFLRLFVTQMGIEGFETTGAEAKYELHIGQQTEATGGRIDIIIFSQNKKRIIIIENKIYAGDQPNQLLRYHNYGTANGNAGLFYLTLFGAKPSEDSTGAQLKEKEHYHCISYHTDIIKWLQNCHKEAANFPLLRETISQYIHLLQHLTGQSLSAAMNQEITNRILKDKESFAAYQSLLDTENHLIIAVLENILPNIKKYLEHKDNNFEVEPNFLWYEMKDNRRSIRLRKDELKRKNLQISFDFNSILNKPSNFFYGFSWIDPELTNTVDKEDLKSKFKDLYAEIEGISDPEIGSHQEWPAFGLWKQYQIWDWKTCESIYFDDFEAQFELRVTKMLGIVDSLPNLSPVQ